MIYLVLASIIWSFVFGLTKYYLINGIDAQLVACLRCLIAAVVFLPFFFFKKNNLPNAALRKALWIGFLYGVMYTPYIQAYKYLQAYQVGLLTLTSSLYVSFFYDLISKKLHWNLYIYATLSILGSYIILYQAGPFNVVLKGLLLVEAGSLCFAYAQVSYKKLRSSYTEISDENLFAYIHVTSFLTAAILCGILGDFKQIVDITLNQWFVLGYVGIFATGIAFYLWNKGCTKAKISTIVICNNLKVPFIAIISLVLFQETTHIVQLLLGTFLIGLALFFSEATTIKWFQKKQPA